MTDLNVEGMAIAPNVVESIASIAVKEVEGVTLVGANNAGGLFGMFAKQAPQGIEVTIDDDNKVSIGVHIEVTYGTVLPEVADRVRTAVADAIASQVGAEVDAVDVYVEGVKFTD